MLDLNSEQDLYDLELQRLMARAAHQMAQTGMYEVVSASPVDDEPDRPSSTFRVVLNVRTANPLAWILGSDSTAAEEHIRKRFGAFERWRLVEIHQIEQLPSTQRGQSKFAVLFRLTSQGKRLWPHDFCLFFGSLPVIREGAPLALQVFALENYVINGVGAWIAILVSIVITAFFIPNMLRKGTIDLLLVKPIHRTTLLLYKFVGGLLFILLNTALAVGGVWIALGLRSGIWSPGFLLSIPAITFFFALLYSVSTLFGVLTRSPIVSILLTVAVWFLLFIVGFIHVDIFGSIRKVETLDRQRQSATVAAHLLTTPLLPGVGPLTAASLLTSDPVKHLEEPLVSDNWFARTVAVLHFVLPRTRSLDHLLTRQMADDIPFGRVIAARFLAPAEIPWTETVIVSLLFLVVMLGLACWRFATRDY